MHLTNSDSIMLIAFLRGSHFSLTLSMFLDISALWFSRSVFFWCCLFSSLANSYLLQVLFTDLERSLFIYIVCSFSLWEFIWSIIYFFAMIMCSFILLLWTMLFILNSYSTEACPWKRVKTNFTTKANVLKWDILAFSNQKLSKWSVASLKSSKTDPSIIKLLS